MPGQREMFSVGVLTRNS